MDLGLKGKTVVVTGGTSGIGKAVSLAFLEEGCKVAVCGRNNNRLENMKKEFCNMPLFIKRVDVTHNDQLKLFAKEVEQSFGKIDIWINNAGMSDPMPFDETTEEDFDKLVNINFKAVFFGSIIAANAMRKTGGGVIINTSSFTSLIPTAGKALYSATKAAVDSLTRTLAGELAADNIRVVSIIPGYIQTEMTQSNIDKNFDWLVSSIAAKRLGVPEDISSSYVFLASEAAKYITGISLAVSGGKFCVQNPMWSWDRKGNFTNSKEVRK